MLSLFQVYWTVSTDRDGESVFIDPFIIFPDLMNLDLHTVTVDLHLFLAEMWNNFDFVLLSF